jgi:hypothetical protein
VQLQAVSATDDFLGRKVGARRGIFGRASSPAESLTPMRRAAQVLCKAGGSAATRVWSSPALAVAARPVRPLPMARHRSDP